MRFLLALAGSVVATSAMSASFFDNFDRADAGDLGINWTNLTGTIGIVNNMAQAPNESTNVALVSGYSDTAANTVVSFDVFHTEGTIAYAGAVLGYTNSTTSIFVKVQDNLAAGNFNRAFFYQGDNGNGGGFGFVDLNPFTSGRIYVSFAGTIAKLDIDTNFDTVIDQSYQADYLSAGYGNGAGLAAYGNARIDNYAINAVPEPATLAALGLGVAALLRRKRR